MSSNCFLVVLFMLCLTFACSRHVPRFSDMDDDDKELFRAAYETPYDHDSYEEEDDMQLGKLDLVKDGLWAMKAKLKELKAFDKALFANLLSTKLKVKELLAHHLGDLKKHHHKKPTYSYESPSYPQYAAPEYAPAQPPPPPPQYAPAPPPPQPQYAPPPAPLYNHDPYHGY